jgi:hypothetical protein
VSFCVSHSSKYEDQINNNNINNNNEVTIMGRPLTMLASFVAVSKPPGKFVKKNSGKGLMHLKCVL